MSNVVTGGPDGSVDGLLTGMCLRQVCEVMAEHNRPEYSTSSGCVLLGCLDVNMEGAHTVDPFHLRLPARVGTNKWPPY